MVDLFNTIEAVINQIISPLNWVMLFLIIGGGNLSNDYFKSKSIDEDS